MNINDVVSRGMCVGCGACNVVHDHSIRIVRTPLQTYLPDLSSASPAAVDLANRVCPFSDGAPNETQIGDSLYADEATQKTEKTGHYISFHAGRITSEEQIMGSSSGGLTSWFLNELLATGKIDGVIHVAAVANETRLFEYSVSHSLEELRSRRKSQYYAVEFSSAINGIRGNGKRYAFVGVPCFVKAVRALAALDDVLKGQLAWHVGLVCGHMKSGAFGETMADQLGVTPQSIDRVDFRVKDPKKTVHSYAFGVREKDSTAWKTRTSKQLFGGNWGHALFQLKACDYCDDIFAETADVCFGDAWLPRYESNWRGTNIALIRKQEAEEIFRSGALRGTVQLEHLSMAELLHTQSGNFRHRHEGLSYRLARDIASGLSVPIRRVSPGQFPLSRARRWIVEIRQKMAARSHTAYLEARSAGRMDKFYKEMKAMALQMQLAYRWEQGPLDIAKGVIRKVLRKALG